MAHLLLVDNDAGRSSKLLDVLESLSHSVSHALSDARAVAMIDSQTEDGSQPIAIILADAFSPSCGGLMAELHRRDIAIPVVLFASDPGLKDVAASFGVFGVIDKSCPVDELAQTIENVLRLIRFRGPVRQRQAPVQFEIIHSGNAMRDLMAQVDRVAKSELRVCILGETGTGKELIARTVHQRSARQNGPFVTLNCAAVPGELIESELFGHEKGSFTGATERHIGKFEQGNRGTLFLDEIGDMPLFMQAKLLRVLEEGQLERVGGAGPFSVSVRVVSATHRNLADLVRKGSFRQDLYHRINIFPLRLPALRDRVEDIPMLAAHLADQVSRLNGWKAKMFSPAAISEFQRYSWPGNVRELRNIVERLMLLADDPVQASDVRHAFLAGDEPSSAKPLDGSLAQRVAAFERDQILAELRRRNLVVRDTADALGLDRSHFYKKCQSLDIDIRALRDAGEV